jgi:undecaprenyl-diphosphatase
LIIHSILLGVVQGITEFLPISSSAHLVILPYLFGWQWQGLVFDVALHFGTLIAILIFFWHDITGIFASAFTPRSQISDLRSQNENLEIENSLKITPKGSRREKLKIDNYPRNMLWMILLATIPGAVIGALLEKQAETWFRDPWLIALNLAAFGIVIWLVDRNRSRNSGNRAQASEYRDPRPEASLRAITLKQALTIGLAQCLAIVPGVSRSGATMAAGRALGLKRPEAAKFSFLLAAPIMFGSAVFEARHFSISMLTSEFVVAFLAALVFGLLAIKYLLKYLERGSFAVFAWYRFVLALIVIIVFLMR